jgi:hypothetical protein
MNRYFQTMIAAVLAIALMNLSPIADAGGRGGGGRGGGGGGGGSARTSVNRNNGASVNHNNNANVNRNNNANVNRNTNVNVNNNVNVNVNNNYNHGGYYGGGCCYHPIATAAAVTATVAVTAAVVGSIVNTVPASCVPVVVNGLTYQQCGSTWYQPQFVGSSTSYVVVAPP